MQRSANFDSEMVPKAAKVDYRFDAMLNLSVVDVRRRYLLENLKISHSVWRRLSKEDAHNIIKEIKTYKPCRCSWREEHQF